MPHLVLVRLVLQEKEVMVFDLAAVTRHVQVLPEWCVGRVLEAATLTHPAAAGTLTHPADGNSK